ncbi:hypothetical protein [Acetobacter malorum]|uniref:hypothetical protein n=1 Tax=Acetobacter malorum TaxID=178901 RepID=UPI000A88A8AB|nr:hypothetical protein [Acetobacter malorum]
MIAPPPSCDSLPHNEPKKLEEIWPTGIWGRRRLAKFSVSEIDLLTWRELSRLIRKRLQVFHPRQTPVDRLARKRFAKKILKNIRRKRWKHGSHPLPKRLLAARKKESKLLSAFYPSRETQWKSLQNRKRKEYIISAKGFSLIETPLDAINILREIAKAEALALQLRLNFSDEICLDVSPYLILGLMKADMAPIVRGGNISTAVTAMVDAVNLSSFLEIGKINRSQKTHPPYWPFKIHFRRGKGKSKSNDISQQPSSDEAILDSLIDTIEGWLRKFKRPLSDDHKRAIHGMISEALNNAERHSDLETRDGDWAIAGFLSSLSSADEKQDKYYCSLSVVSLGASIHESLSKCEDPGTVKSMESYIERHRKKAHMSREALTSVFALQDRVSRFKQGDGSSAGGIGLMDMIQWVNEMGRHASSDAPPAITLLSGKVCIKIAPPYTDLISYDCDKPRNLWFNEHNSLEQPPDRKYVMTLPISFPGTAVAIRFCIREDGAEIKQAGGI